MRAYLPQTNRELTLALADSCHRTEDSEAARGFHDAGVAARERIVGQVVARAERESGMERQR